MRNYYLTTPIYYVTAKPHLGHAYTTVVGDALARWHRLLGDSVHFLTGTDEHGLKVQQYAAAAGKSPQAFVDEISPLYEHAWRRLNISHDDFIRTTEPRHRVGVEALLQRCYDAGDIEPGVYAGKYCVACEEYYTDDELDPGDLCRIHHRPVDYYEEENYFFRLSRFQQRLLDWYDAHPDAIVPAFRRNEVLGVIRSGLRDFSVSRTQSHVGHSAAVGHAARRLRLVRRARELPVSDRIRAATTSASPRRWPACHLLGKDILRHHCIYWPAMLLSAGLPLPAGWAVGGYLLSGGQKMSKTTGNVVNPLELADDVGVDAFRYYLLAETPYGQDGDFSYEGLIRRYNSDLANNLGNLVGARDDGRGEEVRRHRTGARRWRRARGSRGAGGRTRGGRVGRVRAEPGARGDVVAHQRGQRAPRTASAVEAADGARRGTRPGRCARGATHRRDSRRHP